MYALYAGTMVSIIITNLFISNEFLFSVQITVLYTSMQYIILCTKLAIILLGAEVDVQERRG